MTTATSTKEVVAKDDNVEESMGRRLLRKASVAIYAIPAGLGSAAAYIGITARKVKYVPTPPEIFVPYNSQGREILAITPLNQPVVFSSSQIFGTSQFGNCTVTSLGNGGFELSGSGGMQKVQEAANGFIGAGNQACPGWAFWDTGRTINSNPIIGFGGYVPPGSVGHPYWDLAQIGVAAALAAASGVALYIAWKCRERWHVERLLREEAKLAKQNERRT